MAPFTIYTDRVNKHTEEEAKSFWQTDNAHVVDGINWADVSFDKKECASNGHHNSACFIEELHSN